ncbi:hypothetical protein LLH06_13080 [Mucilaginibacter daejeonensis]|nr:hypothetical protein [Mucilaginibacter daejeonensis]UEG51895.1 hypothetical protein LLH06_13080 [Mucilaginibacter daejeonensis]
METVESNKEAVRRFNQEVIASFERLPITLRDDARLPLFHQNTSDGNGRK